MTTKRLSIAPARCCLLVTPPLCAAGGLLVSRQPLTEEPIRRRRSSGPPPSARGARIPRGPGRRAPPWLPREAGRGAGAGAGRRGGVVRPVKIGGGGGRTAHSPQLSGGLSLRTAPSGGCPSQPPASVTSSSNAQVSPRSHPRQVGGCCCGPGGTAHSHSRVGPSRTWWDAPGMEARCRQVSGPVRLPRH